MIGSKMFIVALPILESSLADLTLHLLSVQVLIAKMSVSIRLGTEGHETFETCGSPICCVHNAIMVQQTY